MNMLPSYDFQENNPTAAAYIDRGLYDAAFR